jgi:DNA polymerase III subunit delta'
MFFKNLVGHTHLINHLKKSAENGRIPHAQLFVGKEGVGTLQVAIAYASLLISKDHKDPESCLHNCQKWQHPDLHFAFPTAANETIKTHPVSNLFLTDWREFLAKQPFGSLFDWFQHIGIENKQGQIGVDEAQEIVKALQLKPYEGHYQVMILWMPEKMNAAASNKLLKLIEEPPHKTIFLLVTEDEEQIISTIKSRCQALHFGNLSVKQIADYLMDHQNTDPNTALKLAHQADGSMNKALKLMGENSEDQVFEKWFINWVRAAFRAKGNAAVINDLIAWSNEIAEIGREPQKQFLNYCIQFFRQALLKNYKADSLVFLEPKTEGFKLEKFAPFIHNGNIIDIVKELEDAIYHIERNGNAKIVLLDMSIKLTRLLHAKEVSSDESKIIG